MMSTAQQCLCTMNDLLAIRRGCCSFERELRRLTGYDFISADAREVHILLRVALHKAERLASPWWARW